MRVINAVIWFSCHAHRLLLLLVVAFSVAAAYGLFHLRLNDNLADLIKADNDEYHYLQDFLDAFGADDRDCFVLLRSDDFFTPQSVVALRRAVKRLDEMPEVESVQSILDAYRYLPVLGRMVPIPIVPRSNLNPEALERARERAHRHPLVAGHLLSEDGRAMLVILRLTNDCLSAAEARDSTSTIRDALDGALRDEPMSFTLTGVAQLRSDIDLCIRREQIKFILIGVTVSVLLATYLFRSLPAVAIACLPPAAGATWTMGAMGLVGEPVNTLNSIVPALVMVVGFTDAVHLLLEIRRERSLGRSPRGAAAGALRCLFLPCLLTSVTTAIGFASLAVAQLEVVQRFGLVCAAGAVINFLAVVPLVPFLSTTRLGRSLGKRVAKDGGSPRLERVLTRLVHAETGRSWAVVAIGLVATLILMYLALQLEPDNFVRSGVPDGTESYQALEYCEESFGGAMYSYAVMQWPEGETLDSLEVLRALRDMQQVLEEEDRLGPPFSLLNVMAALPHNPRRLQTALRYLDFMPEKTLKQLVRKDQRKAVVMVQTPDLGARALEPDFVRIENRLQALRAVYPGFAFRLTGTTVVSARNVNLIVQDLASSLGVAALIILGTLTVAFRSLRFGLLTLIPNSLPLVASAGVLWLRGDGLEVQAVVTFSICLGIAVDNTIHVLNRYVRGIREGMGVRSAVESAVSRAGYALTISTLTMLGGFGSGLFSELPALRTFSLLSCVAMVTALIAALILLPALLICFRPTSGRAGRAADGLAKIPGLAKRALDDQ